MNKLDTSVNIDDKSQYLTKLRNNNHSFTELSANNNLSNQVHLGYDPLKC